MVDGGLFLPAVLACGLFLPLLLGVVGWLAMRAGRRSPSGEVLRSARALLDRRLAAGEIGVEEYYEREAALRDGVPPSPPGPRRRW